jgi:hypothetical protein|tara:strand:- start:2644 stop:2751 length:108 start_codon:yes stop_codon:yes gene_type:complete
MSDMYVGIQKSSPVSKQKEDWLIASNSSENTQPIK